MTGKANYSILLIFMLALFGCEREKDLSIDSPSNGVINISVDESFKPVIEEQIAMYESAYPGTDIIAHYKTEAECFRDLFSDTSNRLVIVTRKPKENEEKFLHDSLNYYPSWNALAMDAVAIVVNAKSTDTLFTLERLKDQLAGRINRNQEMVFDGLNATGTVRFIMDSIMKGEAFDTSVVKAAATTNEVLDYIATHENAIGFVGINWIGNPEVPSQVEMLKKVKIAYVQCRICERNPFVKPSQESIMTQRYPLVRGLYYILKENFTGLGTGFTSFLKNERGQLIFKRAYLAPLMDFEIRDVKINQTF